MFAIHEEKRRLIILYVVILLLCISYQIAFFFAKVGGESDSIATSMESYLRAFSFISKDEQLKIQKFQQSVSTLDEFLGSLGFLQKHES